MLLTTVAVQAESHPIDVTPVNSSPHPTTTGHTGISTRTAIQLSKQKEIQVFLLLDHRPELLVLQQMGHMPHNQRDSIVPQRPILGVAAFIDGVDCLNEGGGVGDGVAGGGEAGCG